VNKIFIDTNIFYNILFETNLTQVARKLLEEYEENPFYTSLTVVNELFYVSTRKYYQAAQEISGSYSLRRLIANKGYPAPVVNGIQNLLKDLEVEVLIETVGHQDMIGVANSLKLLPSDAIIALTCKYHGVETIFTFDEDFKRVPWLNVLP